MSPKKILVVGLCCIDHVNYVDGFPVEDTDNRVFERYTSLGGNAANNVTILRQLNHHTELFASLPPSASANGQMVDGLITQAGIDVSKCIRREEGFEVGEGMWGWINRWVSVPFRCPSPP